MSVNTFRYSASKEAICEASLCTCIRQDNVRTNQGEIGMREYGLYSYSSVQDVLRTAVNTLIEFGSYTVHYRIYKDRPTNALSFMFLYFFRC
jgi:hypothetical protein